MELVPGRQWKPALKAVLCEKRFVLLLPVVVVAQGSTTA